MTDTQVDRIPLNEKIQWSWSDLMAATGLKRSWLRERILKGEFPKPYSLGSRQFFTPSEVIDWIEQQREAS